MLTLHHPEPTKPGRIVVMRAGGFGGLASARLLAATGVAMRGLTRKKVDLLDAEAAGRLASYLSPETALVVTSAQAPCKNVAMLLDNLRMIQTVITAVKSCPVGHLVYLSSDAVYRDSARPLTEASCAEPASLHGAMHLTREVMLKNELPNVPQVFVRPTLIFGPDDPHNGYGPNRFMRLAHQGQGIVLFGEGEELRDHIFIEDVADIVRRCVVHRAAGVVNAVTGMVTSFKEIADLAAARVTPRVLVRGSPRRGPVPHGGYRAFDSCLLKQAFPDFMPITLTDGLDRMRG